MRRLAIILTAGLLTIPFSSAMAQLPSGNTGLGDARAQNQPTSRGMPGARWYGGGPAGYARPAYVHRRWGPRRHWGWHHRRHW